MEQSVLKFKCSQSGKVFFVGFTRYSPKHKFQIVAIKQNLESDAKKIQLPGLPDAKDNALPLPNTDFEISAFDFSGWYCPYCGYKAKNGIPNFIECGRCEELVCGSRVSILPNGTKLFACYDECGMTAELGGSMVKSIKGLGALKRIESKSDPQLPPNSRILPPYKRKNPRRLGQSAGDFFWVQDGVSRTTS
jgi:hypothetical protein